MALPCIDGRDSCGEAIAVMAKESLSHYYNYLLFTRSLDDLDKAVRCAPQDLEACSEACANRMAVQLGRALLRRFQHRRHVEDINYALRCFEAVLLRLKNHDHDSHHPCNREFFTYLGIAYLERDGNLDALLDLDVPHPYRQLTPSLETLVQNMDENEADEVFTYFRSKIFKLRSLSTTREDFDTTVQYCRQALGFFSVNSEKYGFILCELGSCLTDSFLKTKEVEYINEAIKCFGAGLDLQSPDSKTYFVEQCRASRAHIARLSVLQGPEDLDAGVCLAKNAVEGIEKQYSEFTRDPNLALCLRHLSQALVERYDSKGDLDDLEDAINASSRAVDIMEGDKDLPSFLEMLRHVLLRRHLRKHRTEDLTEIISLSRRALKLLPPGHARRQSALLHLCDHEIQLSAVVRDKTVWFRVLDYLRELSYIRMVNPELRETESWEVLLSVGNFLLYFSYKGLHEFPIDLKWFYSDCKTRRTIDAAIEFARFGASLGHQSITQFESLLGRCLVQRWKKSGNTKDLEEAIAVARHVVEVAEGSDRYFSLLTLLELGRHLHLRFQLTGNDDDRKESVSLLLECFHMSGAGLGPMFAARSAMDVFLETADWGRARKLSREIIDMLVIVNERSQAWQSKEFLLRQFGMTAATFGAIALEAGSSVFDAVDVVEKCRGLILGHLMEKHVDLDELTDAAPALAALFKTLQNELSTNLSPGTSVSTEVSTNERLKQVHRIFEAEREIRTCMDEIRNLEGFHQFCLGPTETELKAAAARGPIVIVSVTAFRSDALMITKDALDVLALPGLKEETVKGYNDKGLSEFSFETLPRKNREFLKLLEWLWDNCVKLIFDKLKYFGYGPGKFRMWWMGVGVANFLPFHAAGRYLKFGTRESALSRAISSYTPTLSVLIHNQRKLKNDPTDLGLALQGVTIKDQATKMKPRVTLITMPSTPGGMSNLEGVQKEAEGVQEILEESFSTQIFVQPSAKVTMARMAECDIIHFACHGESDLLDPSSSRLLLQATAAHSSSPEVDPLTLRDVADADLGHGKLAFLSACSTAQNRDKFLQDEGLHLVSGFQVAGYLHAIGNLWPSDDEKSVELVEDFYRHIVAAGDFGAGENVAEALNKAVLGLAKKYRKQPLTWAQFVHFGV